MVSFFWFLDIVWRVIFICFTDKATTFKKEISDLLKATQELSSRTECQIHLFRLQIHDISSHQLRFSD